MRAFLKSSGRLLRHGWFWPLVLLALPNCALPDSSGLPPPTVDHGPNPTSAVMCDIPKFTDPAVVCATDQDIKDGVPLQQAAVALYEKKQGLIGLDYSKKATDLCNGKPAKVEFFGEFPDGFQVCLDCGKQMTKDIYPTDNAVCEAQCEELVFTVEPFPPNFVQYCSDTAHVHRSTNMGEKQCFDNICDAAGNPKPFDDLRRPAEPVQWTEQNGTKNGSAGNNLSRTAGRSGNFDAGAYSTQMITTGDGWVEFEVNDDTKAYALGLSNGAADPSETLDDMDFAIVLQKADQQQGTIFVYEKGQPVNSFGFYTAGTRFRITVKDNNDNVDPKQDTATITYSKLLAPCPPGQKCMSDLSFTTSATKATYPLRVDASLVDPSPSPGMGPMLVNVNLVRIQQP